MNEPLVQITDKSGKAIGLSGMLDAFRYELIRNTAYVMIIDPSDKFLLQKRSGAVPNYKNYWDASAGGHIDENETPERAAYRELGEELGITDIDLRKVSDFYFEVEGDGRVYKYYAHVYVGRLPSSGLPSALSDEVAGVKLFSRDDIHSLSKVTPIAKRIVGLL